MIRPSIALAAILSLCSCASKSEHYSVFISKDFSPPQQEAIVNGAYQWEEAGASLTVYIGGGNCSSGDGIAGDKHTVCVVPSTRAEIRAKFNDPWQYVDGRTEYNGFVDSGTSYLAMDHMETLDKLQTIAAHEIAHGMGCHHVSVIAGEPYPLMAAEYNHPIASLTNEDIKEWENER